MHEIVHPSLKTSCNEVCPIEHHHCVRMPCSPACCDLCSILADWLSYPHVPSRIPPGTAMQWPCPVLWMHIQSCAVYETPSAISTAAKPVEATTNATAQQTLRRRSDQGRQSLSSLHCQPTHTRNQRWQHPLCEVSNEALTLDYASHNLSSLPTLARSSLTPIPHGIHLTQHTQREAMSKACPSCDVMA